MRPEDRDLLLKAYESTSLERKRGLVWGLCYVGDEEVFETLRDSLLKDRSGEKLSDQEEWSLLDIPVALGFLADKSDAAYDFVRQVTNPEFWDDKHTWTSDMGDHVVHVLVGFSIQAIGIGGRDDGFLDELKERHTNYLRQFSGDIVQACFYSHLRERGVEFLRQNFMTGEKSLFVSWIQGEGKDLREWADNAARSRD